MYTPYRIKTRVTHWTLSFALLAVLCGAALSDMVDPTIDVEGRPFCYFSRPSTVIGVMDGPEGSQITAEGYLYTGSAELMFFAGDPIRPTYQRIKTLVDGCVPIVQYDMTYGGVRYDFEMFAATLDSEPTSPLINFVKVVASNVAGHEVTANFAAGFCWRGAGPRGIYPEGSFNPFDTYWMNEKEAGRGKHLIYTRDGLEPTSYALTFEEVLQGRPVPFTADGKTYNILPDTPVCLTRYRLDLGPNEDREIVFKMPYYPVSVDDQAFISEVESADYAEYRKRTVDFWSGLFGKMMEIEVAEPKVTETFRASVMYALVARDKIGDEYVQKVNELQYDNFYLRDCSYIARSYDLVGLHEVARQTLDHFLRYQVESGNFESQPGQLDGWGQTLWAFGKHFEMTKDLDFGRKVLPYIDRAVDWLHDIRGQDELHLMPAAGPYDNEAIDGHYTGHSFWCLAGLRGAIRIAEGLGETDLQKKFQAEYDDLYSAFMERLQIVTQKTGGYIPPGLDVEGGNDWGNLLGVYPSGVLPPDHPWIDATWKKMRSEKFLEGVMSYAGRTHSYLTTNVTQTSIIRGDQQDVLSDLYGMLLHTDSTHAGYEWGIAAYDNRDFGGNFSPHGWGAMKLVAVIRNMLVREDGDDLHLLSVVSPAWVGDGKRIAVKRAATDFGPIDFTLDCTSMGAQLDIDPSFRTQPKRIVVHIPWFATVTRAEADGQPVQVERDRMVLAPGTRHLTLDWWLEEPGISFDKTVDAYKLEYSNRYTDYEFGGGKPIKLKPDPPQTPAERRSVFEETYKDIGIAVGKPVTTTGETEGGNTAGLALDGRHDDMDRGWWAHPTPVSMTVDLEEPTQIGGVRIYFYWGDTRYYQYTVEVSQDAATWKTIVDASGNTKAVTEKGYAHAIDTVTARYIRLTILRNSANYASHVVEFKVLGPAGARDSNGKADPMEPLALKAVTIHNGFWSPRQEINRTVTLPHELREIEDTGRLASLEAAAGLSDARFTGRVFNDSDVYKWTEAAAYSLGTHPDPELDARVDEIIEVIAKAQQPDGYLNAYFTVAHPEQKWKNLKDLHELYCAGHLIEAAVAHYEATGKRNLLDVAVELADHIDSVFGPGRRDGIPGHEEIELALVRLSRATGERRYFDLAQTFVDRRGQKPSPLALEMEDPAGYDGTYCQDQVPVREQSEVVGHAVRAMYLYTGVTELVRETGDASLIQAMERLWQNLTQKRVYLTGGIGPTSYNEGFTQDFDLPNDTAYAETCAAIGLVLWAHKLLMLHQESRFADLLELALYNGVLSGVSLDGKRFFYVNPLESSGHHHREEWFSCACCPPNIARLIASLGSYIYSKTDDGIWVNLYIGSTATADLPGVGTVSISQETDYPWSGDVKLSVEPEAASEFAVNLRVPGWAPSASARVDGGNPIDKVGANGYISIRREWKTGDTIELSMPMEVQRIEANPGVRYDAGKTAIRRGPLIYCFEEIDNGVPVHTITIPQETEFDAAFEPDLLGGVVAIRGDALADDAAGWDDQLYREARFGRRPVRVMAIPYFAWDNREPGSMAVWMRSG